MTPERKLKLKLEKIKRELFIHFGAFAMTIGLNNGYTTDRAIEIRDRCIDKVLKIASK